ncbi:MAG: NUDIX hydrolase, partial [Chloroflexi bacterium]|nr:NUDIX hydrolase [Chloroflexota bacterium]
MADRLVPTVVAAVDVVLFTVRADARVDDAWQVLLVKREDAAFADRWSLPGVLLRPDETFDAAARRALRSKTGLDARAWYLEQLATLGAPDRDSRGRVVSVAHLALVHADELTLAPGSDVLRVAWVPVNQLPWGDLAFDHGDMLRVAIDRVRSKVRYSWVAFQLLPETFTLTELRAVYAAILDPSLIRLNTSNFKKAFAALFATGAL